MSQTQETKWIRPDVSSELASIMPETGNQAETRTFSTQGMSISYSSTFPFLQKVFYMDDKNFLLYF